MKRTVCIFGGVCFGCLVCSVTPARAQHSGPYVKAELGPTITEDVKIHEFLGIPAGTKIEFDPGFRFAIGGGFNFSDVVAIGGETGVSYNYVDHINGAISEGDTAIGNVPLMANITFKIPTRSIVTPYVGAGAGISWAFIDADIVSNQPGNTFVLHGSDSDAVFAWQAFGGLKFEINPQMSVGIGYKYLQTESPHWKAEDDFTGIEEDLRIGKLKTHAITFIFTFKF
jgi:opacity protein-like surface antigen